MHSPFFWPIRHLDLDDTWVDSPVAAGAISPMLIWQIIAVYSVSIITAGLARINGIVSRTTLTACMRAQRPRVYVDCQRRFVHQCTNGVVGQQHAIEFLHDSARCLASQFGRADGERAGGW